MVVGFIKTFNNKSQNFVQDLSSENKTLHLLVAHISLNFEWENFVPPENFQKRINVFENYEEILDSVTSCKLTRLETNIHHMNHTIIF